MAKQFPTEPYVDFVELEKRPKVQAAHCLMFKRMFGKSHGHWSQFSWQQHEGMVIERFKLCGKSLALFLGHSKRWADTQL